MYVCFLKMLLFAADPGFVTGFYIHLLCSRNPLTKGLKIMQLTFSIGVRCKNLCLIFFFSIVSLFLYVFCIMRLMHNAVKINWSLKKYFSINEDLPHLSVFCHWLRLFSQQVQDPSGGYGGGPGQASNGSDFVNMLLLFSLFVAECC